MLFEVDEDENECDNELRDEITLLVVPTQENARLRR